MFPVARFRSSVSSSCAGALLSLRRISSGSSFRRAESVSVGVAVFASTALLAASRHRLAHVLSESAARSQFLARRSTAGIGWAIPLCRWPFPRLCGFPSPGHADDVKPSVHPVFEFRVPPESCLTRSSPPAAAGRHLSWAFAPFSTRGTGDPHAASLASARYVAPSGFGYPLGVLLSPSPCRLSFTPAALLGFALRSFLLTEGCQRVSAPVGPTYRLSRR
jgi:hypothetical protein